MLRFAAALLTVICVLSQAGCDFSAQPPPEYTIQEQMDRTEREKRESIARDNMLELTKWQVDNSYQPKYKNQFGHPDIMPYVGGP